MPVVFSPDGAGFGGRGGLWLDVFGGIGRPLSLSSPTRAGTLLPRGTLSAWLGLAAAEAEAAPVGGGDDLLKVGHVGGGELTVSVTANNQQKK